MKFLLSYLYFVFGLVIASAQNIPQKGVPLLENYLPHQYGYNGKIWNIRASKSGIVYMASDNGLLEFDGKEWNSYKDYDGFTRSLLIESDSEIYTGGDMDFGVWTKNKNGLFNYTSLYPYKKDSNAINEEFWNIFKINDAILFISFNTIYVYKNKQLTKVSAPSRFASAFCVNDIVYIADEKYGLFEFNGKTLQIVFKYPSNTYIQITGIYKTAQGLNIVTKNNGIYLFSSGILNPLPTEVSQAIKQNKVFCFTTINNRYLAFGTILNGIYITDTSGKIIQHINKSEGLLNNTILSLYYAKNGKLWMSMDFGISAIDFKSNITYLYDYKGNFGTGYAAVLKDNIFYLGTNQGLYKTLWNNLNNNKAQADFSIVKGSEGQVWSLQNIDGKLLCGHDKGLFEVENNTIKQIDSEPGVWTIKPYKNNYLLTGNYTGIQVFKKSKQSWQFVKKLALIWGSVNQIEFENEQILWASIPTFGLIRFSLDDQFNVINKHIYPIKEFKGNYPHLYKDEQGIKLKTTVQLYQFDAQQKKFTSIDSTFSAQKMYNPVSGFYSATALNSQYGFFPVYNGFALEYFNSSVDTVFDYKLQMRKMEAFNNIETVSLLAQTDVPFKLNNFRFSFIVPATSHVLYQYKLDNYAKDWSEWKENNTVEFINLKEGSYTLLVRAKWQNKISDTLEYTFYVSPPWYRSWFAYLFYFLLASLLVYIFRKRQQLKLKKQKLAMLKKQQNSLREQAEKYNQELLLKTQEQLENEKKILKQQVRNKTIELAKKAKQDEDNIRLLRLLKEKMHEMDENPTKAKIRLMEMRRLLDSYLEIEDKTFEIQMDELHQEFFKTLKEKYPVLSIYDLRMCAYIKIGLNSKEMAEFLQVLPSSINMSRSRIRKKLGLNPDEDLYQFLRQI